jgi:Phage Tail Collar Domain
MMEAGMRESLRVVFVVVVVCCWAVMAVAGGVPQTLNYQGTLTDSAGSPVTATSKPILFNMYNTAIAGLPFWSEQQNVNVKNGQFSVVLGSVTAIPTDQLTGTTYIGITVDPPALEMLPRQKLTSVAYALKAPDAIPKGVIVMWSGTVAPDGWALCNGANGTPDLREKFVMGSSSNYPTGVTGGEATHLLTGAETGEKGHNHSAWTNTVDTNHQHNGSTGGQSASHNHTYNVRPDQSSGAGEPQGSGYGGSVAQPTSAASNDHTHGFTTSYMINGNTSHGHTVTLGAVDASNASTAHNNIPPFYSLAFIQKFDLYG